MVINPHYQCSLMHMERRPSFAEVISTYKQKYETMYKDLSAKYGYEMPGLEILMMVWEFW